MIIANGDMLETLNNCVVTQAHAKSAFASFSQIPIADFDRKPTLGGAITALVIDLDVSSTGHFNDGLGPFNRIAFSGGGKVVTLGNVSESHRTEQKAKFRQVSASRQRQRSR